jgi:hypothetical protein
MFPGPAQIHLAHASPFDDWNCPWEAKSKQELRRDQNQMFPGRFLMLAPRLDSRKNVVSRWQLPHRLNRM